MQTGQVRPTVRMGQDEVWAFLTDSVTGIFTTLRRDGVPIALPVWFAVLDRTIYAGTRGKKLTRIRQDSRSSFLVESGDRWAELKAVHLTGHAEVLDDLPEDLRLRIEAELDRKYAALRTAQQQMPAATRDAYQTADRRFVRFVPDERILNWDNSKLGVDGPRPTATS